tara:strand:- start:11883 stop:12044 length:162 start_codon:yes stop_codon:yes gene_type:complete
VNEFVHLNHRVNAANWDDERGKWVIEITNTSNGKSVKDEAELFINGAGFLKQV